MLTQVPFTPIAPARGRQGDACRLPSNTDIALVAADDPGRQQRAR
jgi:hypothetical protein